MDAPIWVRKVFFRVSALSVLLTRLSTPILVSCGPFSQRPGVMEIGTVRCGLGNPVADDFVKQYLKAVTAEQLQAWITLQQAHLLFPDELLLLSRHLDKKLNDPSAMPTDLILAHDQAFFKGLFYSGDCANHIIIFGAKHCAMVRLTFWYEASQKPVTLSLRH